MKTLNEIADAVHENAVKHGFHVEAIETWWPKQIMNLITEVTELWEADRSGNRNAMCDKAEKMRELGLLPLTNIEEEYADVIIRTLDQCRRLGIDIQRAIEVKHAYNLTRPYKHGRQH